MTPDKPLQRMRPGQLVRAWVEAFNRADVDALAAFYAEDAVNHQVAEAPVHGREAIRAMFASGFATASMTCIIEQVLEDGEWAILDGVTRWVCAVAASSMSWMVAYRSNEATGTNLRFCGFTGCHSPRSRSSVATEPARR